MPGTLFVVATPIGNLEDLTFRALRVLREVDVIAAEDTRRTAKLLARYEVQKPMVSVHEHNEVREAPRLVARLLAGESVALVSDAGTPGVADPGAAVVRACRAAGIQVTPIPGPSAVMAALSVSGLAADQFVFMGFPPSSGADRDRWLDRLGAEPRTVVFFESPHRIERSLGDARQCLGDRQIFVYRELTKINEELVILPSEAETTTLRGQGEFVCVVEQGPSGQVADVDDADIAHLFGLLTKTGEISETDAIATVAARFRAPENRIRRALKRASIAAKRSGGGPA